MRKMLFIAGLLTASLVIGTCNKSPLMVETPKLDIPHLDKAVVTFIRSSIMAPMAKAGLWDRENFIGELKVRSYIQYETTPGKHIFLASSEVWSYLEANLQGGRNYVVKAEVVPGGNSPRINLEPVVPGGKTTQEDINEWLKKLDGYKPSADASAEYVKLNIGALKKAVKLYDEGHIVSEVLSPGDAW